MCGISGGYYKGKVNLDKIVEATSHRGPDSSGYLSFDNFFLSHNRLAIQDLSVNGNQPMHSIDENFIIIFNGEIYNHWDLRNQYLKEFQFRSSSDTETVLNLFIKFGEKSVELLNGIFAFAVYNKRSKDVFIVRDQFGVKPLYIYSDDEQFIFSSEIKTFLNFDINKSISYESLTNYILNLWSPGQMTPFKYVEKLLPGHFIKFSLEKKDKKEFVNYYDDKLSGEYLEFSESEIISKLENLLIKAVKRQLISDVPIGFFLSGGLDSTLIVAIAKKIYPEKNFKCFTINVTGSEKEGFVNDIYYAKKAAEYLDVDLKIIDGNYDILKDFDKIIWHLDEPQADPAPINVYNISKEARKHGIKVLLGGTAADDIFSGYRRHKALLIEPLIEKTPILFKKIIKFVASSMPVNIPLFRRLRKLTSNIDSTQSDRLIGYFDWINPKKIKEIFAKSHHEKLSKYDFHKYFKSVLNLTENEDNLLNKMLHLEKKTFLVDHNLNYTDKMSMAVGVETRVPYLDLDLVEFVKKINPTLKMKGNQTKYILKKVAEKYLPDEIIYRPKSGFGAPVRKWIINDMSDLIDTKLSKQKINSHKIFDYNTIKKMIKENKNYKSDYSYNIWSILSISSWIDQFYMKN